MRIVIIGSGIAGAVLALSLPKTFSIILLTQSADLLESNSAWAQGGIVSRGKDDTAKSLENDIFLAGDNKNTYESVHLVAEKGPAMVRSFLQQKMKIPFDADFGKEAAHSHARILHVADHTGKSIMQILLSQIQNSSHIQILSETLAIDLLVENQQCKGVCVLQNTLVTFLPADATVIATGGAGQIYANTSNPLGCRGDGIAMAFRAGAAVQDLEYVQFHPTVLAVEGNPKVLISEMMRGHGAVLVNEKGEEFMKKYNPQWKDLAPRDEVSRAIFYELQQQTLPHVFLKIPDSFSDEEIEKTFPQIFEKCQEKGFDIRTKMIPVVPAAHYFCGGVKVDLYGKTSLKNLYCIGEASCTGLHGANRLASTSLLEGVVWALQASQSLSKLVPSHFSDFPKENIPTLPVANAEEIDTFQKEVQKIMTSHVGIIRSEKNLPFAVHRLEQLHQIAEDIYHSSQKTPSSVAFRNIAQMAFLVATAALKNKESAGCHYLEN